MSTCFGTPEYISTLEADVLASVGEVYAGAWTQVDWPIRGKRNNYNPTLDPILDVIREREAEEHSGEIDCIRFDIDTRLVVAGKAQRANDWHIDGRHSDRPQYAVANELPTEFLVARGLRRLICSTRLAGLDLNRDVKNMPDGELYQHGLRIMRPEPYEMVAFTDHIHRSPLNTSSEDIARTWMRIGIF